MPVVMAKPRARITVVVMAITFSAMWRLSEQSKDFCDTHHVLELFVSC
jgi:hypothetical protein